MIVFGIFYPDGIKIFINGASQRGIKNEKLQQDKAKKIGQVRIGRTDVHGGGIL